MDKAGSDHLKRQVSGVQDLIAVYRMLAAECDYALHLGLTETDWARRESSRRRRAWECCSKRASAIRFACRSRRCPMGTEQKRSSSASRSAVRQVASFHASGYSLPRLRPLHQHVLPGHGGPDSDLPA